MATAKQQQELRDAIKSGDQARVAAAERAAMASSGSERDTAGTAYSKGSSGGGYVAPAPTPTPSTGSPAGSLEEVWARNIANFKKNVIDANPDNKDIQDRWNRYQSVLDKYGQGNVYGAITSGQLPATSKGDYRGYSGAPSEMAGREFAFDWQTGKKSGNVNMDNPNYDLMRDTNFNYLSQYRDQAFSNQYAEMVRTGQLQDTPENKAWYDSLKQGWNQNFQQGWQPSGMKEGDTTAYVPIRSGPMGFEAGNNIKAGAVSGAQTPAVGAGPQSQQPGPQTAPQQQQGSPQDQQFVDTIAIKDTTGRVVDTGYVDKAGVSYVRDQSGNFVPTRQAYSVAAYDPNSRTATIAPQTQQVQTAPTNDYEAQLKAEDQAYQEKLAQFNRQFADLDIGDFMDFARQTYDPSRQQAEQGAGEAFEEANRQAGLEAEARGLTGSELTNIRRTANAQAKTKAMADIMSQYNQQVSALAGSQYNTALDRLQSQQALIDKQHSSSREMLGTLLSQANREEELAYQKMTDSQKMAYDRERDAVEDAKTKWAQADSDKRFAFDKWLSEEKLKLDQKQLAISARKSATGPATDPFNDWGAIYQSVTDALNPGDNMPPDTQAAQMILNQAIKNGKVSPEDAKPVQNYITNARQKMSIIAGQTDKEKPKAPSIPARTVPSAKTSW